MNHYALCLASASPRRLDLFQEAGFSPEVRPSSYEELLPAFPKGLSPAEQAMFFALGKALDVREACRREASPHPRLIIGADTIVVFDGRVMGKPKDAEDARSMLLPLSGKTHRVISGVCLASAGPLSPEEKNGSEEILRCFYELSLVRFSPFTESELEAYLATEEPYDKAGGYAIQGTFGKYVSRVEGSISNVIGFPMERFQETLASL